MHGCISLGSWKTVLWSAELTGRVDLSDSALLPSLTALFQQSSWMLSSSSDSMDLECCRK